MTEQVSNPGMQKWTVELFFHFYVAIICSRQLLTQQTGEERVSPFPKLKVRKTDIWPKLKVYETWLYRVGNSNLTSLMISLPTSRMQLLLGFYSWRLLVLQTSINTFYEVYHMLAIYAANVFILQAVPKLHSIFMFLNAPLLLSLRSNVQKSRAWSYLGFHHANLEWLFTFQKDWSLVHSPFEFQDVISLINWLQQVKYVITSRWSGMDPFSTTLKILESLNTQISMQAVYSYINLWGQVATVWVCRSTTSITLPLGLRTMTQRQLNMPKVSRASSQSFSQRIYPLWFMWMSFSVAHPSVVAIQTYPSTAVLSLSILGAFLASLTLSVFWINSIRLVICARIIRFI